jgi:hypothetical protein
MTENHPAESAPEEEPALSRQEEPDTSQPRRGSRIPHGNGRGGRRGRLGRSDHRWPARRRGFGLGYRRPAGRAGCGPDRRAGHPSGPGLIMILRLPFERRRFTDKDGSAEPELAMTTEQIGQVGA